MTTASEAMEFRDKALEQLDYLLLDEKEAKIAMLAAMVMGENILLYGPVGGGKTTLGRDAYRLIEGIDLSNVATLPIQADLTPQQLIGGNAESTKETTFNGDTVTETNKTTIQPIIRQDTKVIFANEINRINPFAINAGLEALESGVIDTSAGLVTLSGLEYVVSTMNPSERRAGTFEVTAATASRHAVGANLGNDISDESLVRISDGNWVPTPEVLKPVIDLGELHDMRLSASKLHVPDDGRTFATGLVIGTIDGLMENGIQEARPRISKQIGKTAKALALLGGQDAVSPANLRQAAKYTIASRLGAMGRGDVVTTVKETLDKAVKRAG